MKATLLLVAIFLACTLSIFAADQPELKLKPALDAITPDGLLAHIKVLASDEFEGRAPGTKGDELSVKYISDQFKAIGLNPGNPDGSYTQEVPLTGIKSVPKMSFTLGSNTTEVKHPDHYVASSAALQNEIKIDNSDVVFVGYGIVAPEYGWDDYKDVDVRGKVVVLMNFNPPFKGEGVRLWYGRWDYKYLTAAAHGAAGALIIHTTASAGYPWQVVATSNPGTRQTLPPEATDKFMQFQGWISEPAAMKLAQLGGQDLDKLRAAALSKDFKPQPVGSTLSLEMPVHKRVFQSANVIGILPGTDPKLNAEAVLYTAHHDHLGAVTPVPPATDGIFNGALDNASGCATVLTIERAATAAPPRRSVIFAFVTAEEQGLLGSEYLAKHPPIPAGRIAVDINLDSVNRLGKTTDLGDVGLGKSTADDYVRKAAAEQGRARRGGSTPAPRVFVRSGEFSRARVGVRAIYVKGGPDYVGRPKGWGEEQMLDYQNPHYPQPSDEYHGDWDLSGAVQDAQLQLRVGLRIANAPSMPRWLPGDEFEAARKTAAR